MTTDAISKQCSVIVIRTHIDIYIYMKMRRNVLAPTRHAVWAARLDISTLDLPVAYPGFPAVSAESYFILTGGPR